MLNTEKLSISAESGTRQEYLLSPFLFNIVLIDLSRKIRQETGMKGAQTGKEEVQVSSFENDMIYTEKITKTTPEHAYIFYIL